MLDNNALEVIIGLVFIYLLYSLLGTTVQELIASALKMRGLMLQQAIKRMLDDDLNQKDSAIVAAFYRHPLIKYLGEAKTIWGKPGRPSYLAPESFSKALMDLLRGDQLQLGDALKPLIQQNLAAGVVSWQGQQVKINPETLSYLTSLWIDSQGDTAKFRAALEQWFRDMMERCTGWYKRLTQKVLLGIGLAIAVIFNVDTLAIIQKLEHSPKMREQIVRQATEFTKAHPNLAAELEKPKPDSTAQQEKKLRDTLYAQAVTLSTGQIKDANTLLGLGWPDGFLNFKGCWFVGLLSALGGWALTAIAISLGAPFWFDLLNKVMQLRNALSPQEEDPKKKKAGTAKQAERVG